MTIPDLYPQQLCRDHFLLLLLLSIPHGFLLENDHSNHDDDDLPLATSQPRGLIPAQNAPSCPANCTCQTEETVDCGGLDLHICPRNISRGIQHLLLQVTKKLDSGAGDGPWPYFGGKGAERTCGAPEGAQIRELV